MSNKRSKPSSASSASLSSRTEHRLALTEAKLHELQSFTHDLLIKNNANKEGTMRSTRAFADPLLNMEIHLLKQREEEALAKLAEAESSSSGSSSSSGNKKQHQQQQHHHPSLLSKLKADNEEMFLASQDLNNQVRAKANQADKKDEDIAQLKRALAEARGVIRQLEEDKEALATQVFVLEQQKHTLTAAAAAAAEEAAKAKQGGGGDFDSFFNDLAGGGGGGP